MSQSVHPSARIHRLGIVDEGARIGERTRVWANAHILPGAVIGADCNICDGTFVEHGAVLGDRVTLKCGVYVWDGVHLEDDVFVGPCATFTNDLLPRSGQHPDAYLRTTVRQGASIGANATILPGITLGRHCLIGAGTVVTKDVEPFALLVGNPGRVIGHVCWCGRRLTEGATCECGRPLPEELTERYG
jgi:UDP-2-acetamido-3-amino-2,3-dideoxy-glucuronate N-acetyltransferase